MGTVEVPRRFFGGVRDGGFNASWPLATMRVSQAGLVIRVLGFVSRHWAVDQIESAERVVGGLMGSPGIRFRPKAGVQGSVIVFWTFQPQAVIACLKAAGIPVAQVPNPPKIWLGT